MSTDIDSISHNSLNNLSNNDNSLNDLSNNDNNTNSNIYHYITELITILQDIINNFDDTNFYFNSEILTLVYITNLCFIFLNIYDITLVILISINNTFIDSELNNIIINAYIYIKWFNLLLLSHNIMLKTMYMLNRNPIISILISIISKLTKVMYCRYIFDIYVLYRLYNSNESLFNIFIISYQILSWLVTLLIYIIYSVGIIIITYKVVMKKRNDNRLKNKNLKIIKELPEDRINQKCCICLDQLINDNEQVNQYDLVLLDCGHCYHEHCILEWIDNNSTCPLCRKNV